MEYDSELIRSNGFDVMVTYYYDTDNDAPWNDSDGHGKVRISNCRGNDYSYTYGDKKPGERPLNQAERNEHQYYYDWQDATKQAKRDGWNTKPYDAQNRITRAVQADFDYLRGYINQDWFYVGVTVTILDDDGDPVGESDSLWGVETFKDYHRECAKELANELTSKYIADQKTAALANHIARRYQDAQNLGLAQPA